MAKELLYDTFGNIFTCFMFFWGQTVTSRPVEPTVAVTETWIYILH